jgi:hypothetical protein
MPRRLIELEEALKWIDAMNQGGSPKMLMVCDVQLWRPADVSQPDVGEWYEVAVPAPEVERFLDKGFRADDPNAKPAPKPKAKAKAKARG